MENLEKDSNCQDTVTAFDTLYTTNHIQILKTLLPFLPSHKTGNLAVLIKYLELQYTLRYTRSHPLSICEGTKGPRTLDFPVFYQSVRNFLGPKEQQMFEKVLQMQNMMNNVQEMMQMMELLKDLAPETSEDPDGNSKNPAAGFTGAAGMDPMSFLMGMLSPEQQAMFEMFRDTPQQ